MPTYTCPVCSHPVYDVKVYKRPPDNVKCPNCGTIFNPNGPKEGSPFG